MTRTIIITGGAGFIGSHVVRLFVTKYPGYKIINLDALTYAGNLENLRDIENAPNYFFEKANILDTDELERIFYNITLMGLFTWQQKAMLTVPFFPHLILFIPM